MGIRSGEEMSDKPSSTEQMLILKRSATGLCDVVSTAAFAQDVAEAIEYAMSHTLTALHITITRYDNGDLRALVVKDEE